MSDFPSPRLIQFEISTARPGEVSRVFLLDSCRAFSPGLLGRARSPVSSFPVTFRGQLAGSRPLAPCVAFVAPNSLLIAAVAAFFPSAFCFSRSRSRPRLTHRLSRGLFCSVTKFRLSLRYVFVCVNPLPRGGRNLLRVRCPPRGGDISKARRQLAQQLNGDPAFCRSFCGGR